MTDENKLPNIKPGGLPSEFGLGSIRYNLEVLANTENDSFMRKVAKGEKTYRGLLEESVVLDNLLSDNLFFKIFLIREKFPTVIKNKTLISKIVTELNSLHLEDDGFMIAKYSTETCNRENSVLREDLDFFFNSPSSNKSKRVYTHIKERAYHADDFFSHLLGLKKIFGNYRE